MAVSSAQRAVFERAEFGLNSPGRYQITDDKGRKASRKRAF